MNKKLNLFESAIARLENDQEFMAYFLKKYCEIEHISESDLRSEFNCSLDDYYKLALCKAPALQASDFGQRLMIISEYTHITSGRLKNVIRDVHTALKFASSPDITEKALMAARDKEEGKGSKSKE